MNKQNRHRSFETLEKRELLAGDLRITEINYNPHASLTQFGERDVLADDYEFVELMNAGDQPMNLRGFRFTEGIQFEFDSQVIRPGERIVVVQDPRDFTFRFGSDARFAAGSGGNGQDPGEFRGNIRNSGERIVLEDANGNELADFEFFDLGEWPRRADGGGSSLEIVDPLGDYADPKNWRASRDFGGSPGRAGSDPIGEVIINEILTHTDLPQIDAVEFYNRTEQAIDISGWYFSDNLEDLFRYQFSDGEVIEPTDFLVFDQIELGFSFDGQEADDLFLLEADADGKPTRFADAVDFGAAQNGVSLGRWFDGEGALFPMTSLSFEDFNSGPLIGDIVISEVNYHPRGVPGEGISANDLEFIEIHNRSDLPVDLGQWQIASSVEFTIPGGTFIAPNSSIVIVSFNPFSNPVKVRRFVDFYRLQGDVPIFGPYSDAQDPNADLLDNDGETILLQRPEDINQLGLGYVLVDRVTYRDRGDWPDTADGTGMSIRRPDLGAYGDFGASWEAAVPTPGSISIVGDVDDNGLVDHRDIDQLCLAVNLGGGEAVFDLDRNGVVQQEDVRFLVQNILGTSVGDANLDGVFNSSDFVQVFISGQYEDGIPRNSGWATGDWNCDGEFSSTDFVVAFRDGDYINDARSIGARVLDSELDVKATDRAAPRNHLHLVSMERRDSPRRLEAAVVESIFDSMV